MQKIRFVKSNLEYNVSLKSNANRIVCTFENESDAKNAPISEGFVEINEHNGIVQGNYEQYIYIYKKEDNGVTVILTTDENDSFVEVKPSVTFSASVGGTINGETVQTVDTYEELVIPTPVANENYEFVEWSPSIPNKGDVTESVSFVAIFEYVPTEEEIAEQKRQQKISDINSQISTLKAHLSETDYIFVKCYEASLVGKNVEEYDFELLHTERQALREQINALESELNNLMV